jgi:alanine racemase
MSRPIQACIDTQALMHNLGVVREHAKNCRIVAVVKADGYGHGLLTVARGLLAADMLAVASLEEALVLRQGGIRKPILLLEGVFESEELLQVEEQECDLVVHHQEQVNWLRQQTFHVRPRVWLKVDTGMHRLGFQSEELIRVREEFLSSGWQHDDIILMTHLGCADDLDSLETRRQWQQFLPLKSHFCASSMANSAAVLGWADTHFDWVRPGIMLYGSSPLAHCNAQALGLQPVMTLRSRLIAIKHLSVGDSVGYGKAWTATRTVRMGVVAAGYGDGYPRQVKNGTPVLVNGCRVPLIGRVSMDMLCVDISEVEATIGDDVILWGEGLSVDEIALEADTIAYTLLCGVTARVPRVNL